MPGLPHLRHPFSIGPNGARVVEQDSRAEILQCVYAILATEPGDRDDAPDFGYPDPTFLLGGVDFDELRATVAQWEPRAETVTDSEWVGLLQRVRVDLAPA